MAQVHKIQGIIAQVRIPFRPKNDPSRSLAEEIESCKRKIWECVDPVDRQQYFEKKQKRSEEQENKYEYDKENSKKISQNATKKLEEPVVKKVEEPKMVVQQAPKNKSQPLTRTDIELKVLVMKVVQLRKELKERGQDTNGLKKDLRNRLINVMLEESQQKATETASVPNKLQSASNSEIVEKSSEEPKEGVVSMDISKDSKDNNDFVEEKTNSQSMSSNKAKICRESERKNSVSSMEVEHNNVSMDKPKNDNFSKHISPQPVKKPVVAPKDPFKKTETSLAAIREVGSVSPKKPSAKASNTSGESQASSKEEKFELTEARMKQFSEMKQGNESRKNSSGPPSEVSFSSKASGSSVKDMVSKFSGFSSSLNSSSGSALSKGLQAKKEERQRRIAEMRAKSKPATASKVELSSKEYSSTLSSLNATASTASAKKKNLATQMREKAAARAFQNKLTSSVSKIGPSSLATSSSKRHLPLTNNSNHSNTVVQDSLGATLKQAPLIKKPAKVQSPMDTYEISDREDSDTDDSDSESENEKARKKIPTWAQKVNLYSALEEQYNGRIGSKRADPDDIFPEVQSCDLEAIFGPKKSKMYKRRASSGNWANDQVTAAEKLVYKREMGFATDTDVTEV
eukprot:CAMPEP_0116127452 /NCGR_PEP_ID=MMETSP0329-20121206/6847_1 /TAXON_ID=697910 /ORGANISM="Pseudo-nitzschia arenysensis, Strain B593" /LENGTH=628 /DNA_ID=CAMNT_0003621551 /DNA_START=141 /DNA_END=2027 /DNA_ORIENTATION=+